MCDNLLATDQTSPSFQSRQGAAVAVTVAAAVVVAAVAAVVAVVVAVVIAGVVMMVMACRSNVCKKEKDCAFCSSQGGGSGSISTR